jgi:uncharacterized protein (TIGR02147 family)
MLVLKLNIYNYLDHREYLKSYYEEQKKRNSNFSFRNFSEKVGVKAPSFLQLIIEGKRNIASRTVPKISEAIGHSAEEAEYFRRLVLFGQAKTIKEKDRLFFELVQIRKPTRMHQLSRLQFDHYSYWYSEAIRELLNYYEFNPDKRYAFRKLGAALSPAITESQARQAIKKLLKLGLIKEDGNGCLRPAETLVSTGDEVTNFFVRKYHESMIQLAGESLDRFPKEVRDVSSVTMSISPECFSLLKKEIQQFRKRIMEVVKVDKSPESVYQLNFQFFPMTKIGKAGK